MRERMSFKTVHAQMYADMGAEDAGGAVIGMSDAVIAKLTETGAHLTHQRKNRGKTLPEGYTKVEDMKKFAQIQTQGVRFTLQPHASTCYSCFTEPTRCGHTAHPLLGRAVRQRCYGAHWRR